MMTPVSCLPEDLITEILSRLPVKSLLRFRSVCKKWHTIISSSIFAEQHLYQQSYNSTHLLVCWVGVVYDPQQLSDGNGEHVYSVSLFSGERLENLVQLDKGFFTGRAIYCVCGPCDGIICVRFTDSTFALWNPASRKLWPIPSYSATTLYASDIFSFWIDPLTNDFKVFLIKSESGLEGKNDRPCFVMYTSCNDSWRSFQAEEAPFCPDDVVPLNQCCRYSVSKGFYYFLKENKRTSNYAIIAFDVCNHLFQEIQMPEIDKSSSRQTIYLDLYRNYHLALFAFETESGPGCAEIWVMKEKGCWREAFTVELPTIFDDAIGFWRRNEVLISSYISSHYTKELMIYNPISGKVRKVEVETTEGASSSQFFPLCYMESLISVNKR